MMMTQPTSERPSPYALWEQAKEDPDRYSQLMEEHGYTTGPDLSKDFPDIGFPEIPFMVHALLAMYVPGHGWLATRRGISHLPPGTDLDMLLFGVKCGYRAMRSRLAKDGIRGLDE